MPEKCIRRDQVVGTNKKLFLQKADSQCGSWIEWWWSHVPPVGPLAQTQPYVFISRLSRRTPYMGHFFHLFFYVGLYLGLFVSVLCLILSCIQLTTDFHREPHTWFNFSCTKPFMAQHWHTKLDLALNPIWVRWTSRPFQASRQTRGAPLHQSSLSYCPKRTYIDTQIPGWIPCPFFASFFWVSQV